MIKKIGVENFRVFKDYTEFEIRPITLLVGPNNSGKSSFTKLLLLLKNGINELNFEEGIHNLESYDKVLNWETKTQSLELQFENLIPFLDDSYKIMCSYDSGILNQIKISKNNHIPLINIYYGSGEVDFNDETIIYNDRHIIEFDIMQLIDLIYEKQIVVPKWGSLPSTNFIQKYIPIKNIDKNLYEKKIKLSDLDGIYKQRLSNRLNKMYFDTIKNNALFNEIENLEKDYLLFNIFKNNIDITANYKNELLQIQNEVFSKITIDHGDEIIVSENLLSDFSEGFNSIFKNATSQIQSILIKTKLLENVTLKFTYLGNLLFKENLFAFNYQRQSNEKYLDSFFSSFKKLENLDNTVSTGLNKLSYLSANRGNQKRILHNISENDIDEIVTQFSKIKNPNLDFLNKALNLLNIKGELLVERHENYISIVYIKIDNKKTALADLGFGYSQLIPILLKIVILLDEGNNDYGSGKVNLQMLGYSPRHTLIIEEPEANLHPNLQSKLADIINLALKYNIGLQFIIETHSEYFIRKLQFLTGKNIVKTEDIIIHYFNADEYVSKEEPKVKHIEITKSGALSDTFGPGFYDEAITLQFDLLNINKEQNN